MISAVLPIQVLQLHLLPLEQPLDQPPVPVALQSHLAQPPPQLAPGGQPLLLALDLGVTLLLLLEGRLGGGGRVGLLELDLGLL